MVWGPEVGVSCPVSNPAQLIFNNVNTLGMEANKSFAHKSCEKAEGANLKINEQPFQRNITLTRIHVHMWPGPVSIFRLLKAF